MRSYMHDFEIFDTRYVDRSFTSLYISIKEKKHVGCQGIEVAGRAKHVRF